MVVHCKCDSNILQRKKNKNLEYDINSLKDKGQKIALICPALGLPQGKLNFYNFLKLCIWNTNIKIIIFVKYNLIIVLLIKQKLFQYNLNF